MITFPAKFEAALQKHPNTPAFIVKLVETFLSHEETLEADWAVNSGSSNVDWTSPSPAAGDVILAGDPYSLSFLEKTNPKAITIYGLCSNSNIVIAVGAPDGTDAYILKSSDGETWNEKANPKNIILYSITYGDGKYVAVGGADGADAYILTSSDGETWQEKLNPKNHNLYGVSYGGGKFVAVGNADGTDAYILTSSDGGETWQERANPKNFSLFGVCYGNGKFVAVGVADGTDAYILTSTNGETWQEQGNPKNIELHSVYYGSGQYVAVGNPDGTDAYMVKSTDGSTWSEVGNPKNFALNSIFFHDGLWVAVGVDDGADSYLIKSSDLSTWNEVSNARRSGLRAVTVLVTASVAYCVAAGNSDASGDAYIIRSSVGYISGYIITATMDLGSTPTVNGEWRFSTLVPGGSSITFQAWSSPTGAFAGEETDLGSVIESQAITDKKRYYRVKAAFTPSTTYMSSPTLRGVIALFQTFLSIADHPKFGYEPALREVSTLQTTIDMFKESTIGQVSFSLALTQQISNYLKTKYPKNKEVRILMGFIEDGFTEDDFVDYYRGMIVDWPIGANDTVAIKLRDFHAQWKDVPIPAKWQSAADDKVWTGMHHADVMLDIAKGHIGVADRYIDQDSMNTVKAATPGWVVTRTLTGKTFDSKSLMEELRLALRSFFIPNPDGKMRLKRWDASEAAVMTLTDRELLSKKYDSNADSLINRSYIYFNHDGTTGTNQANFASLDIAVDSTSIANHGETKTKEIKDYWTRTAQASQVADLSAAIITRFKDIPDEFNIELDLRFMALEVADMINLTTKRAPSTDLTGISEVKYQLVNKNLAFKKHRVTLTVLRAA